MFALLYGEFTQDNIHQILLGSTGFCGRYGQKTILVFFFGSQCI